MRGITQRKDSGKFQAFVYISRPKGKDFNITVPGRFNTQAEAMKARMQFITNLI